MFKLHKINPMARAIGTMGAVVALAGGISYAAIDSNTVTLQNNTLTSATAHLQLAGEHTCAAATDGPVTGMTFTNLVPDVASSKFAFCLKNSGNVPLALSVSTPTNFTSSPLSPDLVTLHFTCGIGGATTGAVDLEKTVADLESANAFGGSALNNDTNNVYSCDVTATLHSSVTTSNLSLTQFNLDFVGSTGS